MMAPDDDILSQWKMERQLLENKQPCEMTATQAPHPIAFGPSLFLSIWCWVVLVLHQTNMMAPDDDILSQWKMERQLLN